MNLHLATFLSFFLMAEIHSDSTETPLSCYSCDSISNPKCAESDKNELKPFEQVCYNRTSCYKFECTGNDGEKRLVARSCGDVKMENLKITGLFLPIIRMLIDINDPVNISFYECEENLCNDSSVTAPSFLLFVMSSFTCYFLLKQ